MTSYNYIKYSLKELEINSSECTPSMNSGQHKKILAFLGSFTIIVIINYYFIYTSHSVMIILLL